jgi:hypothetical protein
MKENKEYEEISLTCNSITTAFLSILNTTVYVVILILYREQQSTYIFLSILTL